VRRALWLLSLLPVLSWAQAQPEVALATPPQGVPLQVRRGFFVETDIGTFFTVGGNDAYSNAQSYLQLGVGYDLLDVFEVGGHIAFGANAFNCFAGRDLPENGCNQTDAFTVTFADVSLAYLLKLSERFYLTPKVVGGYTLLEPEPVAGFRNGLNAGVGLGIEYATSMDHFSIGAETIVRYVIGANIPTISIFPRVKYTF
jgi:hypothetical protein